MEGNRCESRTSRAQIAGELDGCGPEGHGYGNVDLIVVPGGLDDDRERLWTRCQDGVVPDGAQEPGRAELDGDGRVGSELEAHRHE